MSKKNLLLCLDAFGTIFSPKRPIAEQYAEVARTFGIESDAKDVGASFKKGKFWSPYLYELRGVEDGGEV